MKNFFMAIALCLVCALSLTGCTVNEFARQYGGTVTVNLPAGERLVEVTWKDADLWYLTEPMDSDYQPKTKHFREDSSFGIMEGEVIFIESR